MPLALKGRGSVLLEREGDITAQARSLCRSRIQAHGPGTSCASIVTHSMPTGRRWHHFRGLLLSASLLRSCELGVFLCLSRCPGAVSGSEGHVHWISLCRVGLLCFSKYTAPGIKSGRFVRDLPSPQVPMLPEGCPSLLTPLRPS